MAKTFEGESKNGAPIIGARYWKKGVELKGFVTGVFDTVNGKCYNLRLADEISIPGNCLSPIEKGQVKGDEFSVGALKGFSMAIRQSGCGELQVKDFIEILCTGTEPTNKGHDRVNFKVKVIRP